MNIEQIKNKEQNAKYRKRMKEALEALNIDSADINDEMIDDYLERNWLTVCTGRDGRDYIWYFDGDGEEACIDVESGDILSPEKIEEVVLY